MKETPRSARLPIAGELSGKTHTGTYWVAGKNLTAIADRGGKTMQAVTTEPTGGQSMSQPLAVIAMKCPGCGAGLQISKEMEYFACSYCGTSIRAVRQGGAISLIGDAIAKVQVGTDRTAAELALVRLQRELDELDKKLSTMQPPVEPKKIDCSIFDPVWIYLPARKANRQIQQQYQEACKAWEITEWKLEGLKAKRNEIIAKIEAFRNIVNQPL